MTKSETIIKEIQTVTGELFKDPKVLLSFSGGKDSIVLFDHFKKAYKGDWKNVTVCFVDEEAMFDGVINIVHKTREEVIALGGTFDWYCMPFSHYSAIDSLREDGTYLLWKESEKDKWIRPKPDFAITHHKDFKLGMSYQAFFTGAIAKNYDLNIQGIRVAESVQRRQAVNGLAFRRYGLAADGKYYPIRNLTEKEVFQYIADNNLDIPIEYLYLFQMKAVNRKVISSSQLRISQLFSSDTIGTLVYLKEFDPDLWERVRRRQPNAYLASMYFGETFAKDFKFDPEQNYFEEAVDFIAGNKLAGVATLRRFHYLKENGHDKDIKLQKKCANYLRKAKHMGDPKKRSLRSFLLNISQDYKI